MSTKTPRVMKFDADSERVIWCGYLAVESKIHASVH